ncbi:MAG: GNAT family N-acetyltransferase [Verrucomicrobia bacterium CG_4_10_14_3_um_filter_43_23]|nr:MAG: hypothetical protein AUJ82_05740 [Verrucomicrobia bacterium CG1_02_43_26]PIP58695.1 MAG: GNAT family N-acetyltransferase [Verrucomicrobia bacterium CG22_combo_CG10-13_8_21_14_all_43_17]PIX59016.1 MAG: GNAT family N-acetyltransferase [Verrucomicrobia bacterium CG_4_10_14_3_um_filter_43_23]PIY61611.1 MAG: GNAT family N-acetyltransferase [Verrucomicrobia bacterium CG_4_10_14_0_8_um_filter_43_34]PJA44520.1 MAG: GNAT family N-acetyltransferase [Verrucomicrobia bacterium CG_4_9_14_3_um_filter
METITETTRIKIRPLVMEDAEALEDILGNPEVMQFSLYGVKDRAGIEEWLKDVLKAYETYGFGIYAVILKPEEKLIGISGVWKTIIDEQDEMELMYRLDRSYWNLGYATEAAEAVTKHCFDKFGFLSIIAVLDPQNTASQRIADNLQMAYEKDSVFHDVPVRVYRLNRPGLEERLKEES